MRYFYWDADCRTVGPVSDREISRLIRVGVLQPDSPLMLEGAQRWETVDTIAPRQPELARGYVPPQHATCKYCNATLRRDARWCPTCDRSTRDHIDAKLASPLKRLVAQCIDWITPSSGTAMLTSLTISSGMGTFNVVRNIAIVVWAVWSMMLFSNGMTPGKWMLGLYVIDKSGDTAGFFRMLIREFIGKPISMVVLTLGFAWILVDDENQGWHDKLCDTYVVED